METLRNFCRVIVGLLFTFSGFVKLIDPLGTAYKLSEYFFAMNLSFMDPIALQLAILLCVTEFLAGMLLILNAFPKLSGWIVFVFMIIFTPFSLWTAIKNPVQDCGCFGDAINLSNWQTFYKNIIFLFLTFVIFAQRKYFKPHFNTVFQGKIFIVVTIAGIWIGVYSLKNLPILDFRPYHVGANIIEGMQMPDNIPENAEIFKSSFIYEKNGIRKSFTIDEIPDKSWKFIEAKHEIINNKYFPEIQNFILSPLVIKNNLWKKEKKSKFSDVDLSDINEILPELRYVYERNGYVRSHRINTLPDNSWTFVGIVPDDNILPDYFDTDNIHLTYRLRDEKERFSLNDLPSYSWSFVNAEYIIPEKKQDVFTDKINITDHILSDAGYYFFIIMPELKNAKTGNINKLREIAEFCRNNEYNIYAITGSSKHEAENFIKEHELNINFLSADAVTLKTIIRSNPGLMLLRDATILKKWSNKNIPEINELNKELTGYALSSYNRKTHSYLIWIYILGFTLFFYLLYHVHNWLLKNKYIQKY